MPQLCTMLDSHVLFKVAFVRTVAPSVIARRIVGVRFGAVFMVVSDMHE